VSYTHLKQLQEDIANSSTTCVNEVRGFLERIESQKDLNAFIEVFGEEALSRAKEIDLKFSKGEHGKLAGMVIGLKDNIAYEGHRVSASSKILDGFESTFSATVVERLLQEDAIIIGRLNCDEFAMGASNETSTYGPVKNAADKTRVPGGSSGGSAVAVQANLCHATLGSDTGGSIRQPASFTGTYGMKPTYGRVSRWGLLAYASSFDQIGPITSSLADMALILEVISGADEQDATLSTQEVDVFTSYPSGANGKKRIAYLTDVMESDGLHPEIKRHFEQTVKNLREAGHIVEGVGFPYLDYLVPCYYVLTTAEASSNLARYSGLMYGHRSKEATDLESVFTKSRSEGFGEEVKRRIMTGTFVLSADQYDAYYSKAQKVRQVIKQETLKILEDYDAIMTPTTPTPAFELGEKSKDPIAMYLADIFTVQAPLAGIPAISIPANALADGLPFGIQFMCNYFEEKKLLSMSSVYEAL
jgi:aspartyl-tRNA(Asn)/glutamyl-tRNA(Gln) amidotransferase subunit A